MEKSDYRNETLIYEYLDKLNAQKSELLIFLAIKDTPGMSVTQLLNAKLNALGLKSNFLKMHWHGYCAVIHRGDVVFEKSIFDKAVSCNGSVEGVH